MDANAIESCAIKSEVILTETFSFCGQFGDYGDKEIKTEPVDYEESVKCKEEDISVRQMGMYAAPGQQFSCNECDFMTMEKDLLVEHLNMTKNVQYSCQECKFTTRLECSLKHFRIHRGMHDKYMIEECNFQPSQNFCLTQQWKSGDKYICNECNYTTLIKSSLRRHVKIHKGAEYKCKDCDYETVRKDNLKQHVKIHTGDEYKCKYCDFKTAWQSNLYKHVKIHTGDEYKCKDCDYKTRWKESLKQHVKIHTGDEYKCKDCDYKTRWKESLKQHVKIHTGDESKCKYCDYKTRWKQSLKEHVKIHTGDKYICNECNYTTLNRSSLRRHVKIHKEAEYKCKDCDYKTVRNDHLKQHVKIHTCDQYKCKECNYKTVRKDHLKQHVKIHTAVLSEMQPNIIGISSTSTFGSDIRKHDVLLTHDQLLSKIPVPSKSFQSFSPSFASESDEVIPTEAVEDQYEKNTSVLIQTPPRSGELYFPSIHLIDVLQL
ncbi:hypothetical protein FQA39_LY03580 [Lamprigera yunnana]|nr:hypothetical protein FQA39_LY03580 [Lamprigera yunnana]